MICEKCSKEYDDSLDSCPYCEQEKKEEKKFSVTISDEDFSGMSEEKTETDIAEEKEKTEPEENAGTEEGEKLPSEKPEEAKKKPAVKGIPEKKNPETKNAPVVKRPAPKKETQKEKNAKNFIVALVVFMAVLLGAISTVGLTTDIFKQDEGVKAVALLGLSNQQKGELEEYLNLISPLVQKGFEENSLTAEELMEILCVGNEGGLFAQMGKKAPLVKGTPDPAERFKLESAEEGSDMVEEYAYYKVPSKDIDEILNSFGVNVNQTINTKEMYYYRGYYYFAKEQKLQNTAAGLKVEIKESKRIQDGRYYVDCSVLNSADAEVMRAYIIAVNYAEITDRGIGGWKITEISHEPIFDSLGIMLNKESEDAYSYEMKTETFEGKNKKGKVYCRYVIEYPVFSGETQGEQAINILYQSLVSAYKSESENAQKNYADFVEDGYDAKALPLQVYITGEVTYNKEKNVSVLNSISVSSAARLTQECRENPELEKVYELSKISKKSYEGYIFDMESGEYVSKDSVIGKDYLKLSEILYRIYAGYSYDDILNEEVSPEEEIPEDIEAIGPRFYEGAAVLCDEGLAFYASDSKGIGERVVIPFSEKDIILISF